MLNIIWYGLATLFLILFARELWGLWQKKTKKRAAQISRLIIFLILMVLSLIPGLLFPPHEPLVVTGTYKTGMVRYTYVDSQRMEPYSHDDENRKVNVVFWYPETSDENETFPLIVFSHGGLGTETSNESLFLELASHGYVVCSIGHPYHALYTKSEEGKITFVSSEYFNEIQREDAKTNKQQSYNYYQKWLGLRTADINFVINTILEKTTNDEDGVYGLIDETKIGLIGHSLGGSAVLAIPRQRDDIDVVIALESPFLFDIIGVENGAFVWLEDTYPIPVLNIYSDSSWSNLSLWSQYARNASLISEPPETAISLHFSGAGHFSLTDLALVSPRLTRFLEKGLSNDDPESYLRKVNQACLEFLDLYLKNIGSLEKIKQ